MKRAVIYARVSTKRQADDGLPVESQIEHCHAKAAALGATVVNVFVDGGISGTTDRRPAFQNALNFCAVAEVDYFICWSSSRFARNHLDAGHYKQLLERYKTRLIYSSSEVDIRTDDGWFSDAISSIIDERYSRQVASDTRRSMLKAARDGFFLGGRVPFGYVTVPDGKRKRLAVHPTESTTVRGIFGLAMQGCGTKMIAMQLNAQGLTLRGARWSKNTVNYLLKNEVYAGFTVFNRSSGRAPNPPADWVRVASHEALIEAMDFERVQTMVQERQPGNVGGQTRSLFAFTGLLRCGTCGASLQTCSGGGRSKVYYYYGCRDSLQGKHQCTRSNIRADLFDEWLLGQLLDQLLTPERLQEVIGKAHEVHGNRLKERVARRTAIVSEVRNVERARSNLFGIMELQGASSPDVAVLTGRVRELNERLDLLQGALADLDSERAEPEDMPQVNTAEAAEALRGIVMECEDPKKLREFVGSFVKEIVVGDSDVQVDYHPECLVRLDSRTRVRYAREWLLDLGSNQGPTD